MTTFTHDPARRTRANAVGSATSAERPSVAQSAPAAPMRPHAEQIARWSELASLWGFVDFLSPEDSFKGCLKSKGPWANKNQPGIYFWLAEDGEAYVGQSISPQSRLRQHWRDYRDIARACFLPCPAADLDRVEQKFIREAGKHFALRNIKHSVATAREVPFDRLVNADERARFLAGGDINDAPWRPFDILTRIQQRKYTKYLALPGGTRALAAVRTFISRAIPKPAATEVGFWSVTLFPSTGFIRVNAGQQEVITCQITADGPEVRVLTDARISLFRSRKARYRVPSYVTAMQDPALEDWLVGDALRSCRRLVVQLMRHTTALNSGSHCPLAVRDVASTE